MSNKLITMSDAEVDRYLQERFDDYMKSKVLDRPNFKPGSVQHDALYATPACKIYRNAAGTHTTTGAYQQFTFDVVEYQSPHNMANIASSAAPITIPIDGIYLVIGSILFTPSALGAIRDAAIFKNGSTFLQGNNVPSNATYAIINFGETFPLKKGETLNLQCYQDTGGNLTYFNGPQYCNMSCIWVGRP